MSSRAWLAVMLAFAIGWMMHDISEQLRYLLEEIMFWMHTGSWGGPAC